MRFKNEIAEQWHGQGPPESLKVLAYLMDEYRVNCLDGRPMTVTDYISPRKGRRSFHPKGLAFDVRIKDFEVRADMLRLLEFTQEAIGFINLFFLKRRGIPAEIQIDPHADLWGKSGQHFHVELDDGFPVEDV